MRQIATATDNLIPGRSHADKWQVKWCAIDKIFNHAGWDYMQSSLQFSFLTVDETCSSLLRDCDSSTGKPERKGKEEYLYSSFIQRLVSRRSDMYHTILLANYTIPAFPLQAFTRWRLYWMWWRTSNCSSLLIYRPQEDETLIHLWNAKTICFRVLVEFHFTCVSVWNETILFQFYFMCASSLR